jgi:hypothetical protein
VYTKPNVKLLVYTVPRSYWMAERLALLPVVKILKRSEEEDDRH